MKPLILIALVFTAFALAGCGAVSVVPRTEPTLTRLPTLAPTIATTPTTAATPTSTATATTAASANPLEGLTNAFRAFGTAKSFRAKMTAIGGTSVPQETNLEFIAPDRFHVTRKGFEAILIGSTFYLKSSGKWQKVTQKFDLSLADPKKLLDNLGVSSSVKFVGPDVFDNAPMLVYEYTTTLKGPPAITTKSKVWLAVSDGWPRKIENESRSGRKTTVLFYDYNATITINAPI